jgi:type II secretion system protein N
MNLSSVTKVFGRYFWIGIAVFVVGLVWNFPYETLKSVITKFVMAQTGYVVDMTTLSPALPIGFAAEGAHVTGPPLGSHSLDVEVESLRLTISPISLLLYPIRKAVPVSFYAKQGTSKWYGSFQLSKELTALDVSTKDFKVNQKIPLANVNPLFSGSDLKIAGLVTISGSIQGSTPNLQRSDFSTSDGELNLSAVKMTIDAPIVKSLEFDKITIDAKMKKGSLEIKSINLSGSTISGKANGTLKLEAFWPRSQINLEAKLNISDKAKDLRSLASTYLNTLGVKTSEDGTMVMKISGPIGEPDRLNIQGY